MRIIMNVIEIFVLNFNKFIENDVDADYNKIFYREDLLFIMATFINKLNREYL